MILVTGSGGFVGSRVVQRLSAEGRSTRRLVRCATGAGDEVVGDVLDPRTLRLACEGVGTVFHCAGYAHAFSSLGDEDSRRHWQINFEGTRNLIEAAGRAGVGRFVFLSSVKAMAEPGDTCANEDFPGEPQTAYGQSKLAAEEAVMDAGRRYGMHVVNLRLAMVYGAGGRGNLERMGRLVRKGVFPPLPETGNRRSLVHVDDVVSAMCLVAEDDRANGRTYIVASHEAPSGRQLFDALRAAQGLQPCGWAMPEGLFRLAGRAGDVIERLAGRRMPLDSEVVSRLLDSACYSPARIDKELGWRARVPLAEGLREMLGV
ncbi:MAG: NAD-dependent epimerase/dehydratase family protein [Gammaproteobacteria bacterium]|nr:NAD-dependent epimerase/dehydratase family protein [Gammaproteobacteria bacterium]MBU2432058.1 NAD-dependent epimerase/dehydratase family protein [Gammaproteobacteria bacterium]MBU2449061.1 NAD-dependent epimerase/dehydratase family protein [Gammaproteobacteria bacterium]